MTGAAIVDRVMPVETRAFAIGPHATSSWRPARRGGSPCRCGLPARRATELAIVVSELASNIVKHGVRGEIRLAWTRTSPRAARSPSRPTTSAPPSATSQMAMTDGYDDRGPIDPALLLRRGGLGTGLGAIDRLADRLEYHEKTEGEEEGGGKVITARFLVR